MSNDFESVEIRWSDEDLPIEIKAASQGNDFVGVDELTYNKVIRVQRFNGSFGFVHRVEFVMSNDHIGGLERSGRSPEWKFMDKGMSPKRT